MINISLSFEFSIIINNKSQASSDCFEVDYNTYYSSAPLEHLEWTLQNRTWRIWIYLVSIMLPLFLAHAHEVNDSVSLENLEYMFFSTTWIMI